MNKLTKAGIATGAAVALLMGGAGTLAYWSDSADLTGGTITAGKLNIVQTSLTGTWETSGGTAIPSISAYRIVPGETLVYTTDIDVEVVGNAIDAELVLSGGTVTADNTSTAADVALASWINSAGGNVDLVATGTGVTATATPGTYAVATTATDITVEVEITFPRQSTAGTENNAMNGVVDLSTLTVTLRQS